MLKNIDNQATNGEEKAKPEVIKLGLDLHARQVTECRQLTLQHQSLHSSGIQRWTSSITCCVFTSDPALMTTVIIRKEKAWLTPRHYATLRLCRPGSGGIYFSFGYRILTVRDPPLASASAVFSVISADLIGLLNQFTVEPDEREQCENE